MKSTCEMRVLFVCGETRCDVNKPKIVYCPKCKRKVATWDGRSTIDVIVNCRKCNKRVIYRVATGETEIKIIPARGSSSGITIL